MVEQAAGHWTQVASDELFRGWKRWVSFACIWAWSCLSIWLATKGGVFQALPSVLSLPNEVVLIATSVTLLIVLLASSRIASIMRSRWLMGLAGGLLLGGSCLYAAGAMNGSVGLVVAGMAMGGASIALLKVGWGEMYSRMGLLRSLVSLSYALIASSAFALIVSDLPEPVLVALLVAVSLPCAPLAYRGGAELEETDIPSDQGSNLAFSPALLILPIMVGLSYGLMKGMLPSIAEQMGQPVGSMLLVGGGVAGIALLAFSYGLDDRFGPAQIYSIGLIFVVAGLVMIASGIPPLAASLLVHDTGFSIFYFFMIVYWGDLSRRTGMPIVRIYAAGYFCFQGIQALMSIVGFAVSEGSFFDGADMMLVLSAVLAIFIASLLLFGDGRSPVRRWLVAQEPATEQGDAVSESCYVLAERHGLSPREREVLALLARGRNAPSIARVLCISPDTAKSHIKNIYRKASVHSQQNLLDLLDGKGEQGDRAELSAR